MKISSFGAPVALFAAAALTLSACAANETANPGTGTSGSAAAGGTLAGKGASSMSAAQQKWIADYQSAHPGVTINYSPTAPVRAARRSPRVPCSTPAPTVRSRTKRWAPASSPSAPPRATR